MPHDMTGDDQIGDDQQTEQVLFSQDDQDRLNFIDRRISGDLEERLVFFE